MRLRLVNVILFVLCASRLCAQGVPATDSAPASVIDHQQKARAYLQQQKPALAIPEFQAIVAADPQNLDAQGNLGVLLYFTGRSQEAEPHLRTALALDPRQSKIQVLLGFCEHRSGELDAARTDLTAALPNIPDVKTRRQAGLELVEIDSALGDLPAAGAAVSQLKAQIPTDPEILYAAYSIYTQLGQEAMLDLSVAAPNSGQMHQAIAHQLALEHDNPGAIKNLREALAADPNLPAVHSELADALYASSQPALKAEAEGQYRLALQQNPKDDKVVTHLGDIAADKGEHDAAMGLYRQALADQPGNTDAEIGLAHELAETGKPEQAEPLLLAVVKADPTNVLAHYRLSALYRRLHRPEDAKREIAEYERLKALKDKLQKIYETMRLDAPAANDAKP